MARSTFTDIAPSSEGVFATLKYVCWNEVDGRLRAGWRIVILAAAVVLVGQLLLLAAEQYLGARPRTGPGRRLVLISVAAIAMTVCVPLARRFLDGKTFVSLGLRFDALAVKDVAFGWLLGGLMTGGFFLILLLSDRLDVVGYAWQDGAVMMPLMLNVIATILAAWSAELFLRGYVFDNFVAATGLNGAVILSCTLYSLYHVAVASASLWSTMVVAAMGFLGIFGLLTTQQLWLSMGVYMGWTFFNGPIFGFEDGIAGAFRLIQHSTHGTPWFAGGAFGSEGSILMLPIIAAAGGIMYLWSRRVRWNANRN